MPRKAVKRSTKKGRAVPPVKARHRRGRKTRLNETAIIHQDIYPVGK